MNRYSLRTRILIIASLLSLIFFSITAAILDSAFSSAAKTATQEKLQLHILSLISNSEQQGKYLIVPAYQQEPRFNQVNSGLYGYVLDRAGSELWRSKSALNISAISAYPQRPGQSSFSADNNHPGVGLFVATYGTIEESNGRDYQYTFVVMEDNAPYQASLHSYRQRLWLGLTGVAVMLLAAQHLLLSRGLKPLQHLASELKQIEEGYIDALSDSYPNELNRLTGNLNRLIDSERKQRERYHQRLGDLAHSLKTPLAVLSNAANDNSSDLVAIAKEHSDLVAIAKEQCQRMDQIVRYQLQRAVVSQQVTGITRVNILEHTLQIKNALDKVYHDKCVLCEIRIKQVSHFQGDQGDLMELLGNLMDNAYKYGAGEVKVSVVDQKQHLQLIVEDNGIGIEEQQREKITQRGARLDTQEQGQGIGMAVVVDIVKSYQGQLTIEQSDLLGAKFIITFPKHHY
ncbi:MAG: GHKL domain-containing protein [Gammaproteobacteria bacterium]|nr:GHKL domain-containing protein [Gammaproteobacteria bacterium]